MTRIAACNLLWSLPGQHCRSSLTRRVWHAQNMTLKEEVQKLREKNRVMEEEMSRLQRRDDY